jgi:orotidine-5'-phosphate decarboxylase
MKEWLIPRAKSVIVACDVPQLDLLKTLVDKTSRVEGIGAYKVGLELALGYGLPRAVEACRKSTDLPLIYDHQKGGVDTPDLGDHFAGVCRRAGVDAVILFPLGGPESAKSWINACHNEGLMVLVGAHMTQRGFLGSEGGFVVDSAPEMVFDLAAREGVRDFVIPGNRLDYVRRYKGLLEGLLGEGSFALYAPGFITQGGSISETGKIAGERWHAIVGRAIYEADDMEEAAKKVVKEILGEEER